MTTSTTKTRRTTKPVQAPTITPELAQVALPGFLSIERLRVLSAGVDKLGKLNAKIAELQAEAELIKVDLKSSGAHTVYGKKFKAVVVEATKSSLDTKKAKGFLSLTQIAECTKTSKSTSVALYDL